MTDDRPETREDPTEDSFDAGVKKLEDQASGLHVEIPGELDEEFDERMQKLEEKAAAHRAMRENVKKEEARKTKSDREAAKGLGIGLSVAYTIIGLPVFGYGVGWLIARQTGSTTVAGFGMLIGAVLGIAAAILMLNRHQNG